jgi:hypothetical protein
MHQKHRKLNRQQRKWNKIIIWWKYWLSHQLFYTIPLHNKPTQEDRRELLGVQ